MVPFIGLAEQIGLAALAREPVRRAAKIIRLVVGMPPGAHWLGDIDMLRQGAMTDVSAGCRLR